MHGRQSCAGKIVKRKDASAAMSLVNQSQLSHIQKPTEEDEFKSELNQYPMGEMLLREEEMQNSMSQGYFGGARKFSADASSTVNVPLQKRVDLMMIREKEKQERLENLRNLKEVEEVTGCTFQPKLISGMSQMSINPYGRTKSAMN